jgi:hypothetical protein
MRTCAALAVVVLSAIPAMAVCTTHDPYDPRCKMSDFSAPIGTVEWFMDNQLDRQATLIQCRSNFPPPRDWCLAALEANRVATGSAIGK